MRRFFAPVILLMACGPVVSAPVMGETSGSESTGSPSTTGAATTMGPVSSSGPGAPSSSTNGSGVESSSEASAGASTTGCVDMGPTVEPDPNDPESRCLYDELDCGCGYRCTIYLPEGVNNPWANSGCFPLDPDPVALGDACMHEDYPWSGWDNCPEGTMCEDWDGDGQGLCREFCTGDPDYECADPNAVPYIGCQSCGCICKVSCDPLGQDPGAEVCPEGQGCYVGGTLGVCAPDASGDGGAFAEPCEYINACDGGLMCVSADAVPGCPEGSPGCCTPHCDFADPNCPEGTECVLLWDAGQAETPILEDLGVCADPAVIE